MKAPQAMFLALAGAASLPQASSAAILYDQMSSPNPAIIPSSWVPPDGTDSDTYSWDNFLLAQTSSVNEVSWIGGGGSPTGFTVRFYEGLPAAPDLQPKISALPESETPADYLKGYRFNTPGSWSQTDLGGGLTQYHVTLPTSLTLTGNTVYWLKVEGDVSSFPSWGLATATHGRDAMHFRYITGMHMFQRVSGSEAFQLGGTAVPEPGSMAALGLGALALLRLRKKQGR